MRNLIMALGLLMAAYPSLIYIPNLTPAQQENPAYAKWGMLAIKETKQKYPDANIIDYLHVGSETNGDTTIEKFKLWLKEDRHEFGVFVNITFNTETGKFLKINFQETSK
ncbi:YqzG/YhdC family protein [Sporosarcina sp. ACRSL]|uniref:DUF3889 domain-containing protein n=1 Tax=Sporosarcina sp. ACRSL TaxID=2918215 RepID=UPI001EF633AA|nr:DUF3889 domain-containing protein [Sporosarcina sp. ACRSL]MCG7345700.1 YqzG/YhdC family protein [Sporosarcina sp. ACRSL]